MATRQVVGRRLTVLGLVLALVGVVGVVAVASGAGGTRHRPSADNEVTLVNDDYTGHAPGNPAADDGELHDARTYGVSYAIREESYSNSGVKHLDAYGMDVEILFTISYPKLEGDIAHLDTINDLLRSTARETLRTYYEDPDKGTVERVRRLVADADRDDVALSRDAEAYLSSNVSYAVTYNSEDLLSVCFSDEYSVGTWAGSFITLRTVNVNLKTGEVYELDDVLTVDEAMATAFVDNLVATSGTDYDGSGVIEDDECYAVSLAGRAALVEGIQGEGELAKDRMSRCLFVDGNGRPNLGVNYWLSGEGGFVRGWWDVTLTDELLEGARKDSTLWDALA